VCASVCVTCRVKEGYVRSEQRVGYFIALPSRHGLVLCAAPASGHSPLLVSATPAQLTILTLLRKLSTTVIEDTVEPLYFCLWLSPCSSYASELLEIILWWNADTPQTKLWTRLPRRVTLHGTWRPGALTTEPHGQVNTSVYDLVKYSTRLASTESVILAPRCIAVLDAELNIVE